MGVDDLIRPKRELIRSIAEKHGALNVRVFGSVARGDAGPDSDVDLLVDTGTRTSAWFPGGLVADLEEALGRRVDVVTERGLVADLRERVLREAVPV
jgi:predicted nucleotidyltransferase